MKFKFFNILFLFLILGCSPKIVTVTKTEYVHIKDSSDVQIKDSVVFHHKTVNKDYAGLLDTLRILGEHSSMTAYADTSKFIIKGNLTEEPFTVRTVYKDRTVIRDTTIYVKEPFPVTVEVEKKYVPGIYKWALGCCIILLVVVLGYTALKIYLKFVKPA